MRKKIIAANWKMNLTHREILPYLDALLAKVGRVDHVEVVLIPAFTALPVLAEALTRVPGVQLGAQNMHWAQSGAFTGEVSPAMLQACSVRYVMLGHSERRVLFGETDEGVNRKVLSALNAGLNPILCVGESLEERESGRVEERLGQQLRRALTDVPPKIFPRWSLLTNPCGRSDRAERQPRTKRILRGSFAMPRRYRFT